MGPIGFLIQLGKLEVLITKNSIKLS